MASGGTPKVALHYAAVLIGTYLVVYYATGAGKILQESGSASVGLVKAFQGR